MDIPTVVEKTWVEVISHNDPPQIYRRGGRLVRIEEKDNGDLILVNMDINRMRGFVARCCWFTDAWTGRVKVVEPPKAVIADMLVNIDIRVPLIDRIVRSPVFAYDGTLVDEPGYNEKARIYYDVPLGLVIPPLSDVPDNDELAEARSLFEEMLVDFPFEGEADKAHAYALCLQMFCRDMIDGPTPLYGSESPVIGTGKGKLVDALLYPALGNLDCNISQPGDDEEWRKQLITSLMEGPAVIKIDNVIRSMDSGVFANVLTTNEFGSRVLGTMSAVSLPVRCAWVMTGNNPVLSSEIARRYIRMRLVPDVDRPWLRDEFKHPDLMRWVHENRGKLIWAALTMIRYGIQHNPRNPHRIGSFENWAKLLGNILDAIGVPGFLGNINDIYEQSDVETSAWTYFVNTWWNNHSDSEMLTSELYDLMTTYNIEIPLIGKNERALKTSFGRAVLGMKDRVFTIDDNGVPCTVRIVKLSKLKHKAAVWKLEVVAKKVVVPPAPTVVVPPEPDKDDPFHDDLERERLAIEAAFAGDFELAEQLIELIDDTSIKDRTQLSVEQIQFNDEV